MNANKLLTTCMLMMAAWSGLQAQTTPTWPEATKEAKAGSRWWWHGSAVDKDNLKWQMEQLAAAGIGNLEITPIYGVKNNEAKNIAYLSDKWLEMLNYVQQEGDALGIDIDMTTGTGWPFGGPMVKKEESASKLVTETFDVTGDGTKEITQTLTTSNGTLQRVMAFPQSGNDGTVTNLTAMVSGKTLKWTAPAGKWKIIVAYNQYGVMQVKRPSPGSEGYVVDYFSADAVANYLKYFDNRFTAANGRWPHSFFNDSYEINAADWTPKMFEEFEARRGYKLEENLDKLLNRDKQVYADYRQTLSDMLQENFTRQWTAWAHNHGATTRNQAHGSPGNLIDLYAEADIPEIENFYLSDFGIKGLRDDKGFYNTALSSRATLKYASSAAHITGKPLTSSESMTWLTEHFRTSLSQIKPELDLLFTSGVNHVLFHGTAYSPKDAAWPGWKFYAAIDMSPTNSIWYDAPSMMKYIERVQSFLQMGKPDNDVLVYAPFAYAMHKNSGDFQNKMVMFDINKLSQKMTELEQCVNNLEAMGLDCDYTSEHYLMHTTFVDGMLQTAAGTRYQALVIPVTEYLPDSVKTHIEALRQQGAQIVEGYKADALNAITVQDEQLRTLLGLSVIRRSNDHGHHYFVANLMPDDVAGYVALAVPFQSVVLFDPMTGNITKGKVQDGKVWISLKSGQSLILQTYDTEIALDSEDAEKQELGGLEISGPWTLTLPGVAQPYTLEKLQSWEKLDAQAAIFMGTGTYETTFAVTAAQMKTATHGFRIDLGDVRESARVWLNGEYIGCAWAAPFVLDCAGHIKEGSNTLRIEVTNLPANRISDMDRQGVVWRIFEDINMSTISGSATFDKWSLVPSGLNSTVKLVPVAGREEALTMTLKGLVQETDGKYYLQYLLSVAGSEISSVAISEVGGKSFTGFKTQKCDDGTMMLTVTGKNDGALIVQAADTQGKTYFYYVYARGAYEQLLGYDLTDEKVLGDGWGKMATTVDIMGFTGSGKQAWWRSKKSTATNTELFSGLTFSSEKGIYYSVFPGFGLNAFGDFTLSVDEAAVGDLLHVTFVKGEGDTTYSADNQQNTFVTCEDAKDGLQVDLIGRNGYTIYPSVSVYRPTGDTDGIRSVTATTDTKPDIYTLQGVKVSKMRKGLYIRNGQKFIVK